MKTTLLALVTLAFLPAFQPALAQGSEPTAPAAPAAPPKEMAQLAMFEGRWTCSGGAPEGPMGPARKSRTGVMFHKDLDGMWVSGRIEEAASKDNPHPLKGMVHMGYDAVAKGFVMLWVDNGGAWAVQTASGWDGDTMTWVGDGSFNGQKMTARDTFTKKGADLHHLGELQVDGAWVVVQDELCKRQDAGK